MVKPLQYYLSLTFLAVAWLRKNLSFEHILIIIIFHHSHIDVLKAEDLCSKGVYFSKLSNTHSKGIDHTFTHTYLH